MIKLLIYHPPVAPICQGLGILLPLTITGIVLGLVFSHFFNEKKAFFKKRVEKILISV